MMKEFKKVRQVAGSYRRLFTDEYFDLFVWYRRKLGKLTGFQLCYDIQNDKRALTWGKDEGFSHDRVDEGDAAGGSGRSPILIPNGVFSSREIADRVSFASRNLRKGLARFIYNKLMEYESG